MNMALKELDMQFFELALSSGCVFRKLCAAYGLSPINEHSYDAFHRIQLVFVNAYSLVRFSQCVGVLTVVRLLSESHLREQGISSLTF